MVIRAMSIYNNRYNVLFIHVPKTAGTSMEREAFLGGGGHKTIRDFSNVPDNTFKFSFVRNPWDRFVSAFYCQNKYLGAAKKVFTAFVMNEPARGIFPVDGVAPVHFLPQYHFLLDTHGKIGVDYIGRFEILKIDWAHICAILDVFDELPHIRKGNHQYYKNYYTPETWDIVGELYKRDVDLFDYGSDKLVAESAKEAVLLP